MKYMIDIDLTKYKEMINFMYIYITICCPGAVGKITVTKKSTLLSSPGGRALGSGCGGQFPLKPKIQGISSFKYKNTKQIDYTKYKWFKNDNDTN